MRMSRKMALYAQAAVKYLYKHGTVNNVLTGGLTAYNYRPGSSTSARTTPKVTLNSDSITLSVPDGQSGTAGTYFAENAIELTKYDTVKIQVKSATTNYSNGYVRFGAASAKTNEYVQAAAKTICSGASGSVTDTELSLDISNLSGSYYLYINLYGGGDKKVTFTKWWIE